MILDINSQAKLEQHKSKGLQREIELDLKTSEIPYEERDHALYIAFGPYKNPRYEHSY